MADPFFEYVMHMADIEKSVIVKYCDGVYQLVPRGVAYATTSHV